VEDAYSTGILRLLNLEPSLNYLGEPTPWRLTFSPSAYDSWKDFQRRIEVLMRDGGKLCFIRDWASKLPGAAARIAGLFHSIGSDASESHIIDLAVTEQALNIAARLIDGALAVFDLMQGDPAVEDAERILRWIRKGTRTSFSIRDCFCAHQAHFRRVDALHVPLQLLTEHGYIQPRPRAKASGRPSGAYLVNPEFTKTFTCFATFACFA
jgi:putative DNA primase/helicase